jgi:hypothetical protein
MIIATPLLQKIGFRAARKFVAECREIREFPAEITSA